MESNSEIRKAIKRGSLRASFFMDLGSENGVRGCVPTKGIPVVTNAVCARDEFRSINFIKIYGDQLVFGLTSNLVTLL